MESSFVEKSFPYTGMELHPHWIFEEFGIRGDAAVAWIGPCYVPIENLVDIEDADAGAYISSDEMVHLVAEHFLFPDLLLTIHRQNLLAAIAQELIFEHSGTLPSRRGNDLYVGEYKLSVSIATVSPVSGLIHFGINVLGTGAPLPIACLSDMEIPHREFARDLVDRYRDEILSGYAALSKVKPR